MSVAVTTRNALGYFLRACREELGLSREGLVGEIHMRTGYRLGACHYGRIEWGVRRPSADALDKIADALHLHRTEKDYLFSFIPEKPRPTPITLRETVPDAVHRVVQFQQPAAAYVIDRRLDIVDWNDATCEIYGADLEAIKDERERNLAWLVFSSSPLRERLLNWEIHAKQVVALCRNRWAGEKDSEIQGILQRMLIFPQFATWWGGRPRVALQNNFRKEINHPDVGMLVLEQTSFQLRDNPNLDMVLTLPLSEADTEKKLKRLMSLRQRRRTD